MLSVSLSNHRGIHMSRCEEVLFDATNLKFESLDEATLYITENLKKKQESDNAFVKIN
jgi:GTP cyclohydrolase FolE2